MDFNYTPPSNQDPLKEFGRNLTDEAINNKLEPVIGCEDEIRRLIRILSRKTKNNPCLVGDPGVGKTAIVEALAMKIVSGNVPENLKSKEVIEIDLPAMMAGASFFGQFEKRLKDVMKKIKDSNGSIIVFIDEVHTLVGTGKHAEGGMDAAQIIKPMLAKGEMRLIGATTLDEYRKYIESDPALERRMQKILVSEPSVDDTITILRGIKERMESYHGVKIHDSALVAAAKLSTRYISDRFLPDKAIDLVDEASAAIQTEMNSMPEPLEKAIEAITKLEMEKVALTNEKDDKSRGRLIEIMEQLEVWQKTKDEITTQWNSEKEIVQVVTQLKDTIEQLKNKQQRFISEGNYEAASRLLYKEIPEQQFKLDEAVKKIENNKFKLIKEDVTEDEIASIVSKWTRIPMEKLLEKQKDKLLLLETNLKQRIKGQDKAVQVVADAILRSRANINDPNRPIGSFIFTGPTGVGKTEVARALAYNLFDSEKSLIRLDMSEFAEKHSISKLLGSPPGYVGYGEGGQLTEKVRRQPYSIVLFDEIEKAHPEVLNVLLQILDDGHITDSRGKFVNFKNTIIIMTTNINAVQVLKGEKDEKQIREELLKYLKPEFINRVDEIVIFEELKMEALIEITKNELEKLRLRLQEESIFVEFSDDLVEKISAESYDPLFGARPIKRKIQKEIESRLAKKIIANEIEKTKHYTITKLGDDISVIKRKLN